jgi:serine/threonine protein kinase
MNAPGACPSVEDLRAFLLGQFKGPTFASLEHHISECRRCSETLHALESDDTVVARLKKVQESSQTLPQSLPSVAESISFLTPAQGPDEIGRLGAYRVLRVLGTGGMGIVFEAEDPHLKRTIALKTLKPSLAASPSARRRFLREAQSAASLNHDHIVSIYQVGEECGVPFLAMPVLEGESLEQRLQRQAPLPINEVLRIGRQIAEGLAAAHACGLIHRDIKPANVWLESRLPATAHSLATAESRVKIVDFGLVRAARSDPGLTQSGAIIGSPAYMAPEQARAEEIDARCDLFSLGCVLYRMCTGELPFKGKDVTATLLALVQDKPQPPREINRAVTAQLSDLIMRLLAKDRKNRPGSAREVAAALAVMETRQEAQSSVDPAGETKLFGRAENPPVWAWRRRWKLVVAVAVLVVLGVSAYLYAPTVLHFITDQGEELADKKGPADDPGKVIVKAPEKKEKPSIEEKPGPKFINSMGMEFALIPKGKSWLGGGGGKPGTKEMQILHDFYLGVYEVTQEEWQKVTGERPSFFKDAHVKPGTDTKRFPVEQVSWNDAQKFLKVLNEKTKENGWVYRLPKEAEWEYACRGGPMADRSASAFDFYLEKPANELRAKQANFVPRVGLQVGTVKVGSYPPNRLGLHDMHGNVWEWCMDSQEALDGATERAFRGGAWYNGPNFLRAWERGTRAQTHRDSGIGLRVARVPRGKELVKIGIEEKKPPIANLKAP